MAPLAAQDNLALFETMQTGDPALKPGPAARAFYHEAVNATFRNPTLRNAYLNNAWNLFRHMLGSARAWEGLTDRVAVRREEWGATAIVVDAHGIPSSVTNNPNDAQNELRFKRYRPDYRQGTILLTRDEFTPITVDPVEVGRMLAQSADATTGSAFLGSQLTQALNANKAREFNTLWDSYARFVGNPNLFYVNTADLNPATITTEQAIAAASAIRATVKNVSMDFTNRFSPAKHVQTVPVDQVRLVISVSAMQAIGIGYATAFNPENIFALPADQVIEVPDQYFLSRPEFAGNQVQWTLVDAGNDTSDGGTFIVVDSMFEQAADPYAIKGTYNQAIHHAAFLDVNPFKTLVLGGPGTGTSDLSLFPAPDSITLAIYTDQGTIAPSGTIPRGVEFSTDVRVVDDLGESAGGYRVEIIGATSPTGSTAMLRYSNGKIGNDELSTTVTVKATSLIDPSVTVSHTYTLTGVPMDLLTGATIVSPITFPGTFAAGSGSGGTYTYTAATGVVYTKSATLDGTRTALGTSPVAVPTGTTIYVFATAAEGFVFADGTTEKVSGPHTAA